MCQKTSLHYEFDLIEAKCRGVNEQVNMKIYIETLKNDLMVFTMYKVFLVVIKFRYHFFKGQTIIFESRVHCLLVN